ncbi:MAG: DNA topoisomerase VI subunit B [Promethearchaeota archaeon]
MTAGKVETLSAAQWFKENSEIAGFDNPGKSTFTSVRELVENSLDAAEEDIQLMRDRGDKIAEYPKINVIIQPVSHERIRKKLLEHLDVGGTILEGIEEIEIERDPTVKYYVIEVSDNGPGIPHEFISLVFGTVFTGTKYGIKQGRGRFGMGAKMAMIHAQRTTGLDTEIWSSTRDAREESYYRIRIDLKSNSPIYTAQQIIPDKPWHGLRMRLYIGGNLTWARARILDYFRQLVLVTPYVNLQMRIGDEVWKWNQVTDEIPPLPSETKPHPYGIDIEGLKEMIARYPKKSMTQNEKRKDLPTLIEFLTNDFQGIGEGTAKKFIRYYLELDPNMRLNKLNEAHIFKLAQAMSSYEDFPAPDSSCLSILSPESLEKAANILLEPEYIKSVTGKIVAIKGHPVHITTSVSFGGNITTGVTLYRFANRIPLLFKERSDVCYKALEEANIKRYIDINVHGVTVIVSVVSTRMPYQDAAKDFIADYDELRDVIKSSMQKAFRRVKTYITHKEEAKKKEKELEKLKDYANRLSKSLAKITRGMPMSEYEIQHRLMKIIKREYV